MKMIFLVVSVFAVLVYGDHIMRQVDDFLEKNQEEIRKEGDDQRPNILL